MRNTIFEEDRLLTKAAETPRENKPRFDWAEDLGENRFEIPKVRITDGAGDRDAVHLRHVNVHQDEIEGAFQHGVEGFESVLGEHGAHLVLLEHRLGDLAVHRVVLGNENAQVLEGAHPERVVTLAVKRMLPGNRLSRKQMTNLRVYAGGDHPHEAQNPEVVDVASMNKKNTRS